MTDCDLSIIIVNWNVRALLLACLESIERVSRPTSLPTQRSFSPITAPDTRLEVIVVDNDSHDGSAAAVNAAFPWVTVLQSGENLGFSAGNNRGYATSRGATVYFLNPDTEQNGESLWTLYTALLEEADVVMAGPQLRFADGTLQSSRRRFPTASTGYFESTWLGQLFPRNRWAQRLHMEEISPSTRHEVDWLVGAALLARRAALEAIKPADFEGPFDEGFFMYSEELDLCHRLKSAGGRIVYVPDAVVTHHEGRSSEQVVAARHLHFNRSKIRYVRKVFGERQAAWLRRYLLAEYVVQRAIEQGKLWLGHKRTLRRQRIEAYNAVLRDGLYPTP